MNIFNINHLKCIVGIALIFAGIPCDAARSLITVPELSSIPVLDGAISKGEWDKASCITGLANMQDGTITDYNTSVYIGYKDGSLYVAFDCINPDGYSVTSIKRERDKDVFKDDSVEIFLSSSDGHLYNIIVNANGSVMDGKDDKYPGPVVDVQTACKQTTDGWQAEISIDAKDIAKLRPSTVILANFCRNLCRTKAVDNNIQKFSHWAGTQSYSDTTGFGELKLGTSDDYCRIIQRRFATKNSGWLKVVPASWNQTRTWKVTATIPGREPAVVSGLLDGIRTGDEVPLPELSKFDGESKVEYSFTNNDDSGPVAVGSYKLLWKDPFSLTVRKYLLTHGLLRVEVDASEFAGSNPRTADMSLLSRDGKILWQGSIAMTKSTQRGYIAIPIKQLAPGIYDIECKVLDDTKQQLVTAKAQYERPDVPEWANSKLGESDKAPAPWVPVKIQKDTVSVWGRKFQFGNNGLISTIFSAGSQLLYAPVRMVAKTDKGDIKWVPGRLETLSKTDGKIVVKGWAKSGKLSYGVTTDIEFDGFTKTNFTISSAAPVKINSLFLEIPIRKDVAKFLWHGMHEDYDFFRFETWPKGSAVPTTDWATEFVPILGIFDHERGLEWYSESAKGWNYSDPKRAIEIVHTPNGVILRFRLIDTPTMIKEPMKFNWGLMPSPVKPIAKDWRQFRFCFRPQNYWGDEKRMPGGSAGNKTLLEYSSAQGMTASYLHEPWENIFNYPITPFVDELKAYSAGYKKASLRLLVYSSSNISVWTPELNQYGDEFRADVVNNSYGTVAPMQKIYGALLGGPYGRFWIESFINSVKKYNLGGIYMDGTPIPPASLNPEMGLGWQDEHGKWRPQWPIYAHRDFMKRLYFAAKAIDPKFYFLLHGSTGIWLPTSSFADSYFDGESFSMLPDYKLKEDEYYSEFYGWNLGIPSTIFYYAPDINRILFNPDIAMAYHVLNDNLVWTYGMNAQWLEQPTSPGAIWRMMDKFGVDDAKFTPMWKSSPMLKASDPSVKVSVWKHPSGRLLIGTANLVDKALGDVTIRIDKKALGQLTTIKNALTGEPLTMSAESNTFTVSYPKAYTWYYLWADMAR